MLSPLPRRSDWVPASLTSPALSAFPGLGAGSACASSFSRLARRSLALRPAPSRCHQFVTRFTRGFNHFITSIVAPVASGWSGCRVGLSPTGKAPPLHGAPYKRTFRSYGERRVIRPSDRDSSVALLLKAVVDIGAGRTDNFSQLVDSIGQLFTQGHARLCRERTLLTSGALSFLIDSLSRSEVRIETLALDIRYRGPAESYYAHGMGS